MKNVTLNFPDKFLADLDAFATDHHLKRNAALMMVFTDFVGRKRWTPGHAVGYGALSEPARAAGCTEPVPGQVYQNAQSAAALPLIRSPEDKAAALALLKPKLAELPDVKGIHEANQKKPDPPGWDEFDQSGKDSE